MIKEAIEIENFSANLTKENGWEISNARRKPIIHKIKRKTPMETIKGKGNQKPSNKNHNNK